MYPLHVNYALTRKMSQPVAFLYYAKKVLRPTQLNMSDLPTSKRARLLDVEEQHEHADEEDQSWKYELVDWLDDLRRQKEEDVEEDSDSEDEGHYDGHYEGHLMIERLLQLPSEDPVSDEAFAALMENAAYCCDWRLRLRGDRLDSTIHLGRQADVKYTQNRMPYITKFLTEIPKILKSLRLTIDSPEVIQAFPDQIGCEGCALEEIAIFDNFTEKEADPNEYESEDTEFLASLGNMLYLTRNIKDVDLAGFRALPLNSSRTNLVAFESKTKKIKVVGTICGETQTPMFLHPDTSVPLEILQIDGRILPSGMNGLEASKLFWRQCFQASRQTLSTIKVTNCYEGNDHVLEGMCTEAANLDIDNIKTIELHDIEIDLLQILCRLASSRVGSTLKRFSLQFFEKEVLPSLAPTLAGFENLEDVTFHFDEDFDPNPFLMKYFRLQPAALRKVSLKDVELSSTLLEALFSNKTLESIKLEDCRERSREFFLKREKRVSSNLRSLDIEVGAFEDTYDTETILRLLEILQDLRCLKIDGTESMDEVETRSIVNAITKHQNLCLFECVIRTEEWYAHPDRNAAFNQAMRLPCLRNRFNASDKQLPLGFIPKVIVRSEELCEESGIFQFLKEQAPSYLGR